MKKIFYSSRRRQKGAVLVVGLLILLVMTLVGVTTMQTTRVEEKMAGNVRDRNMAFQAAESALRDAEEYIEGLASVSGFASAAPSKGLYGLNYSEGINFSSPASSTWDNNSSRVYSRTLGSVNTAPRYMIKIKSQGSSGLTGALNIQGYGKQNPSSQAIIFRITARGTGGTDNSMVFLQTYYGKLF